MKHSRARNLRIKTLLIAGVFAFGTGLSAQMVGDPSPTQGHVNESEASIIVERSAFTATFVGGTTKSGGHLKVRISSPEGETVYDAVSEDGILDWHLDASLPDGQYRWNAWFSSEPASDRNAVRQKYGNSGSKTKADYRSGVFEVRDSSLVTPEQIGLGGQASTSWPERVFGAVLNFLVPDAAAQDFHDDGVNISDTAQDDSTFLQLQNENFDGNGLCNQGGDFLIFVDGSCAGGASEFVLQAGSPDNSMFIESTGNIGFGTNTPERGIHLVGDSQPTLFRVEEPSDDIFDFGIGSGGDFIVEQVAGGADGVRLHIDDTNSHTELRDAVTEVQGDLGVGTAAPGKKLHVQGASAGTLGQNDTMLRVENTSETSGARRMIELINNGSPLLVYRDTSNGAIWNMSPVGESFAISLTGTGAQEFQMDGNGNLTIQGSLTQNSMRSSKEGYGVVDADTVLAKLDQLSIEEWSYKHTPDSRHMSPMAEDFYATFGLGPKDGIAPTDLAGVALAAVKALKAENDRLREKVAELDEIKAQIADLQSRVAEKD